MKKTKVKGFMTLQGVLMVVLLGLLALSFLQIYSSQFSALTANRKALQAQQFAQSEADFLRNVSYDELDATAHTRQAIAGANGWMSEVSLDAETTVNGVQQRLGTIKVYRNSTVAAPDFSLQVPLTVQGSGNTTKVNLNYGAMQKAVSYNSRPSFGGRDSFEYNSDIVNVVNRYHAGESFITMSIKKAGWYQIILVTDEYKLITVNGKEILHSTGGGGHTRLPTYITFIPLSKNDILTIGHHSLEGLNEYYEITYVPYK